MVLGPSLLLQLWESVVLKWKKKPHFSKSTTTQRVNSSKQYRKSFKNKFFTVQQLAFFYWVNWECRRIRKIQRFVFLCGLTGAQHLLLCSPWLFVLNRIDQHTFVIDFERAVSLENLSVFCFELPSTDGGWTLLRRRLKELLLPSLLWCGSALKRSFDTGSPLSPQTNESWWLIQFSFFFVQSSFLGSGSTLGLERKYGVECLNYLSLGVQSWDFVPTTERFFDE